MREDLLVSHYIRTDVGVKRSHNQDAFGVGIAPNREAWRTRGHLFVVADGMGAHAVGELASQMAVDTIRMTYSKARSTSTDEAIRRAITEANASIHERGLQNREFAGMGTTATALVLGPDGARIGHVGDSRCYRIRADTIEQLSFDHSLLWDTARRQNVAPEDLKSVPKNIIVRSLGPEPVVNVDVHGPHKVRDGDRFLLCTDGLSGQVTDREIWTIVSYLPPEEACEFLIDLANYRGGVDNVTLILVQVGDPARPLPKRFNLLRFVRRAATRVYRLLPLRHWLLLAGSSLAGIAVGLKYADVPGSEIVALPGIILALAGLFWFAYLSYRRRRFGDPPPPAPPPVYRSQQCTLQRSLVEKLAKSESFLREAALEHEWNVDFDQLAVHREEAERNLGTGKFSDSFREYCRALAILFVAMREARNKQEVFDPHWQTDQV